MTDVIDLAPSSSAAEIRELPPLKNGNGATPCGKDWGKLPADLARDSKKEIERLAGLSRLKYQEERKEASASLGIGLSGLDEAVREERRTTGGQGKPLVLPEPKPWDEPVNGQDLLSDLIAAIRRYVVMDGNETVATALWVIKSHAFKAFNITPRLAITSPEKRCGKTTLLDILSVLVPRRLFTSNVGPAAVFRAIEMAQPTLLIDEADTFLRNNDELRGILNSGHRKGGSTLRCVGENHEPREFSTWAPAAIAMIGRLPDTLEDRAIAVRLRRRRSDEAVERLRVDKAKELEDLARKAARWAADNFDSLSAVDPVMPSNLNDRAQDNWRPLVACADQIGGEWPERVRRAAEGMAASASGDDQSAGPMLLADIRDAFQAKGIDRLSSDDLVAVLASRDDRPWPEWKHGKAMTKDALARQLTKFGIISENIRFAGSGVLKGYHRHRFEDAFSRYLPSETATPLQPDNDGDFLQNQNATQDAPVAVSKCDKPLRHSDCSDVALCETPQRDGGIITRTPSPAPENTEQAPPAGIVCAQCGAGGSDDPPTERRITSNGETVWLHRECVRFWKGRAE